MRTQWLFLLVVIVAMVSACQHSQNRIGSGNPDVGPKVLIIEYDVLNRQVLSVKDKFAPDRQAKNSYPERNGIPEIPEADGGPMGKITRVDVIKVLSDLNSPGCVCYGSWCICY